MLDISFPFESVTVTVKPVKRALPVFVTSISKGTMSPSKAKGTPGAAPSHWMAKTSGTDTWYTLPFELSMSVMYAMAKSR